MKMFAVLRNRSWNPRVRLLAAGMIFLGTSASVWAQATVYEQSRFGSTTSGTNNPDFTFLGFTSTLSANKSTAPGIPAGSSSCRLASTSIAAGAGTNFTVAPNHTTAQLQPGTTYAVAITFGNTGNNETSDLIVATADTGCGGNDTFAGQLSGCFKSGNGYNTWITVGSITVTSANPTINFAYASGTNPRWYVDTIRFTPQPASATAQYWNTGSPGGSGTWDTTTANWNSSSTGAGAQGVYNPSELADFGGTAGTVMITSNGITSDGGLEFDTTGYILQGGILTLGQGTNIAVAGGANIASINSSMAGTNGMATIGLGTLVLNASNSLTGTITLAAGTLSLGTNETFTSLAGGPGALMLNSNTLTVGDSNSTSYTGVIEDTGTSAPGYLIKQGPGVLSLGAANTYHGTTTIMGGALAISADLGLGAIPATAIPNQLVLSNGGRLDFTSSLSLASRRGITLGAGGGVLSSSGTGITPTISGPITGTGSLTIPTGGFDFTGSNSFSGNLYLTGTPVDSGGNNFSSIRLDSSYAAGTGKIFVSPSNGYNFTLRTYTATNVVITNAVEFDLYPGAGIYLSGAISGGVNCSLTFAGPINGTGSVLVGNSAANEANAGGTVNLLGDNGLWNGTTTLEVANLGVGTSTSLGTGLFNISPIASSNVTFLALAPLSGANAITNRVSINLSQGSLTFGGTNNLELSGPVTLNSSIAIAITNPALTALSGPISDANLGSSLSLSLKSGVLSLGGSNSYDGGTSVLGGTLLINNLSGSGTGTGPVTVSSGAILGGSGTIFNSVDLLGTLSPGTNGPGLLTSGSQSWEGGASYNFKVNEASGAAGAATGWSQANIAGGLTINATSNNPFTINVMSLTSSNTPGLITDFNSAHSYSWSLAHTANGIAGFNPAAFVLNTDGFSNSLGNGSFSLATNGTDLLLNFTAPSSGSMISSITVSSSGVTVAGSGGTPNAGYRVLTSTNLMLPLTNWMTFGSSNFDSGGNFVFTGSYSSNLPMQFYTLVSP